MVLQDSVEAIDLEAETHRSEVIGCGDPQLLDNNTDRCLIVDKRQDLMVVMAYK